MFHPLLLFIIICIVLGFTLLFLFLFSIVLFLSPIVSIFFSIVSIFISIVLMLNNMDTRVIKGYICIFIYRFYLCILFIYIGKICIKRLDFDLNKISVWFSQIQQIQISKSLKYKLNFILNFYKWVLKAVFEISSSLILIW